jgi:hypothetical protein
MHLAPMVNGCSEHGAVFFRQKQGEVWGGQSGGARQAGDATQESSKFRRASAITYWTATLVTGDKTHFGRLYGQSIAGVRICPPQGQAEMLAA